MSEDLNRAFTTALGIVLAVLALILIPWLLFFVLCNSALNAVQEIH